MVLSVPLRLMAHPFRGYATLAASTPGHGERAAVLLGLGRLMLVLGAFVAVSATGRFAPIEAVLAMVSFAWLPLAHGTALALVLRIFSRETRWTRAFGFYLEGLGPWLVLFLVLTGACIFAPQRERPVFPFLVPMLFAASVWGVLLSYAFWRSALALARRPAILATIAFWLTVHTLILGYYLVVGQLWPIL